MRREIVGLHVAVADLGVSQTDADPDGLEAELFEFGGVFDAGSIAQGGIQPCAVGAELLIRSVSPSDNCVVCVRRYDA